MHYDTAIVGAGMSGLAMATRLRRSGRRDFVVLEQADDIGGTWRDNTYPGCSCDVPSRLYSFSFAPNPAWSTNFSPQPEIQAYIRDVARREEVMEHVRLGWPVADAQWDEAAGRWRVRGPAGELTANKLVAAAGTLHTPKLPDVPGLERFEGRLFHSARWDHDYDLSGKRVAVVGTGSSGVQIVPGIQPEVERLHLVQRSPAWVMPRADRATGRLEQSLLTRAPGVQHLMRKWLMWGREAYALPLQNAWLARVAAPLARLNLRRQVRDPELRGKLTPRYAPGCKRVALSNDYYQALAQPNVEVIAAGLSEVREHSIVAANGSEREVDAIVFATGFQVAPLPIADHVRDGRGRSLAEHWGGTQRALRGTMVAGFPNLFLILGPGTGPAHSSALLHAETQVGYVMRIFEHLTAHGYGVVEARPEAEREWHEQLQRRMRGTVWTAGGCGSWYLDAHGMSTVLWPGFTFQFRRELSRFDPREHRLAALPRAA